MAVSKKQKVAERAVTAAKARSSKKGSRGKKGAQGGLSYGELLEFARKNPPPANWYEEAAVDVTKAE